MPIRAEAVNRSTTFDPAKLVPIVRRWCPGVPVEVPITLVKELIEAAASGGTAFFAHVGGFVAGIALIHLMGARQRFSRRRDLYW